MATFTIIANVNLGDKITDKENLFYKIYNNDVLYYTSGSASNDANVSLSGTEVTIINVPVTGFENFNITITAVDESHNEASKSNEISLGVVSLFEEGLFVTGLFN